MRRALRLAEKGRGFVLPNPMVGAILVKDGERIGEGYHKKYGSAHAEVNAINSCEVSTEGSTLYVTLEPCSHHGNTPPCVDAIIEAGIKKVIIASKDPSRNGVEALKEAGIEVESGILEEEARKLNKEFFCFHKKKRPYVTLKAALSLDGKLTKEEGVQTKITGDLSQRLTHVLRHEHHAILIGAGTALIDDPHLGVRKIEGRDPLRIILKGERELPSNLKIFRDENHLIFEREDIKEVLKALHEKGVRSVLVEGGAEVLSSFIEAELWDEAKFFYGPKLIGDQGLSFYKNIENHGVKIRNVRQCGPDLLVTITPWDSDLS